MKEDSKEFYARKRKSYKIRKKPKDKLENHIYSKKLDQMSKEGFMRLLTTKTTTLEQLEMYNSEWVIWLDLHFNETRTRYLNKTIFLENIPFYSSVLFRDYEDIFLAITYRQNPFHINFKRYQQKFTPKEYTIETIDSKLSESISLNGAFYYILPKKYEWFELEIKGKEILSNIELKLVKSRAITLPKGIFYWGFVNEKSKPYFLNYFLEKEFEKKLKFKTLERKRLLENNLRERGFVTNFVEGVLIWDIGEIPMGKLRRDVLVMGLKEGLFKSFLIKSV
jgi:hypothetical protein